MKLNDKRILITGGSGFLGFYLIRFLIEKRGMEQKNIRIFDINDYAKKKYPEIDFVFGNILDFEELKKSFEGIDIVFHLAASTSFDPSKKKEQWMINVEGTRNVIDLTKELNIKKLCYVGSVNSLGMPPKRELGTIENSNPYREPRVHSFSCPYEILEFTDRVHNKKIRNWQDRIKLGYFDSKLAAQELMNRAVEKDNLNIVSVLPGTFFGQMDDLNKNSFGNHLYLMNVYKNKVPGVLDSKMSLLHVEDAVSGIILAMENGVMGGKYIITGNIEDNMTMSQMMRAIVNVILEKEPEKKIRMNFPVFSTGMAKTAAFFSGLGCKITGKTNQLNKEMVECAIHSAFYAHFQASEEIGYIPQKSFKQAISETYDSLKAQKLI
jgi:nucleoside-diphosphate-sugar epimerase